MHDKSDLTVIHQTVGQGDDVSLLASHWRKLSTVQCLHQPGDVLVKYILNRQQATILLLDLYVCVYVCLYTCTCVCEYFKVRCVADECLVYGTKCRTTVSPSLLIVLYYFYYYYKTQAHRA